MDYEAPEEGDKRRQDSFTQNRTNQCLDFIVIYLTVLLSTYFEPVPQNMIPRQDSDTMTSIYKFFFSSCNTIMLSSRYRDQKSGL